MSAKQSTYLPKADVAEYIREGQLLKFKYSYEDDRESLEMLFADIDDPQQTMEAIISKIIDETDPDFGNGSITTWQGFREKVDELSQKSQPQPKGQTRTSSEISVLSWRKFKRIVNKATKNDDMFANRANISNHESILEEIDYKYPAQNAYFGYMTRGCPRNCEFCAVKILEPEYKNYIGIQNQIRYIDEHFGPQKDLYLMDNNVFASKCFNKIIDEIKACGFGKGASFSPPNEYEVAIKNLQANYNPRAYIRKIIGIYDQIAKKLPEDEAGDFYLRREADGLLYVSSATSGHILDFDDIARPLYSKYFPKKRTARYIDFNQGLDARLVTSAKMEKLSEINIRPLRIAFDHYEQRDIYIEAVRKAAEYHITDLSNYLLYNFEDRPEELYYRMRINVDLCEELGVTIYSFPMKYHPISDPKYFRNRDYIGKHWNRKFIRSVQAVLNSTKGKIGRGVDFFEEAFGRDVDEFKKILWMPETFIVYRRVYDADLRERLADRYTGRTTHDCDLANEWWEKFSRLPPEKAEKAKEIIALNKFKDGDFVCNDQDILDILSYYRITRDDTER